MAMRLCRFSAAVFVWLWFSMWLTDISWRLGDTLSSVVVPAAQGRWSVGTGNGGNGRHPWLRLVLLNPFFLRKVPAMTVGPDSRQSSGESVSSAADWADGATNSLPWFYRYLLDSLSDKRVSGPTESGVLPKQSLNIIIGVSVQMIKITLKSFCKRLHDTNGYPTLYTV